MLVSHTFKPHLDLCLCWCYFQEIFQTSKENPSTRRLAGCLKIDHQLFRNHSSFGWWWYLNGFIWINLHHSDLINWRDARKIDLVLKFKIFTLSRIKKVPEKVDVDNFILLLICLIAIYLGHCRQIRYSQDRISIFSGSH